MLHDLLLGVAHHLLAREVGVGGADTCIEDTEVVVDLGHCADGRAGIGRGALLLDSYDRAESYDLIDIWSSATAPDEATGIGGESV